jgi:hypothetical protein
MASSCPNCPSSSSHMHGAEPLFDHRSMGDKPNYRSGGYLEKHVATPINEQQIALLDHE